MHRDDPTRLRHMLDAASEAISFLEGQEFDEFSDNRMLALAVVKELEIVGEAAGRVTEDFRRAHPEIAWNGVIGMRHRLVHGYFEVDFNLVWDTVHDDLPHLISCLEELGIRDDTKDPG